MERLMPKLNVKQVVTLGLLIGIEIVLSRFLSISTPMVKIGFAFIPVALAGMLFGPVYAGAASACADFLGAILFPVGPYFPGFTLTAFLTGAVYGAFLYNVPLTKKRVFCAVMIIAVLLNLGLGSLWLQMLLGKSIFVLLPPRIIKCMIVAPLQMVVVYTVCGGLLYKLRMTAHAA